MGRVLVGLLLLIAHAGTASIVDTRAGKIQGEVHGAVVRYLGVPYAEPPLGPMRWRSPEPPQSWSGVRPAIQHASACPQIGNFFASDQPEDFDKPYGSEDCLYLNIWAPLPGHREKPGDEQQRPLPVLVFFHGGSGIAGSASHPLLDGERLSRELGAMVVTANYRLGVLGSLQNIGLRSAEPVEDSGSFYLLDMIRVLDWLGNNCPSLGCDSQGITIAGQSAGAVAVLALLRSPLAVGKFQRAISFSGLPFSGSVEQGEQRGDDFISRLMLQDGSVATANQAEQARAAMHPFQLGDYLYNKSVEALLNASGRGLSPIAVADGTVLMSRRDSGAVHPVVASRVPLLIGRTRNELTSLVQVKGMPKSFSAMWPLYNGKAREQTINQQLGWLSRSKRKLALNMGGKRLDKRFYRILNRYAAQLPAVYAYRFDWDNYPEPWRSDLGATHSLDVPFIFGNFIHDRPVYLGFAWTEQNRNEREELHRRMAARLRAFVHTGNPNPPGSELEPWPAWGDSNYRKIWDSR